MKSAGFFAIGPEQWTKACELGLNPSAAFLVLARGTGHDNITTKWSAEAVAKHAGIDWRRARDAVVMLERAGLAHNVTKVGKRKPPLRKLSFPDDADGALWLPNTLVTGAGDESPPLAKLRRAQNPEHLEAFIRLYDVHNLPGDGGLPRSLVWQPFTRKRVCERGPFVVFGFTRNPTRTCRSTGPLARFAGRKDGKGSSWDFLTTLERFGLVEVVDYLAEGESPDAELIHTLADVDVTDAAHAVVEVLPEGMDHVGDRFDYVLPVVRDVPAPAVVGVFRLRYRPHTSRTSTWYSDERYACHKYAAIYRAIAAGDFSQARAA